MYSMCVSCMKGKMASSVQKKKEEHEIDIKRENGSKRSTQLNEEKKPLQSG